MKLNDMRKTIWADTWHRTSQRVNPLIKNQDFFRIQKEIEEKVVGLTSSIEHFIWVTIRNK